MPVLALVAFVVVMCCLALALASFGGSELVLFLGLGLWSLDGFKSGFNGLNVVLFWLQYQ